MDYFKKKSIYAKISFKKTNKMDLREEKFNWLSEIYTKYRPSYPTTCIEYVLEKIENSIQTIADIWAWTGKLSKAFLGKDLQVYAIEPHKEMLKQAKKELQNYPKCKLIQATAEDTTLEDSSIDLITIGQAFHRFNNAAFKNEAKRILKKEKYIAIFYNNWEKTSDLIQKIHELSKEYCPLYKGSSWWLENQEEIFKHFFKAYEKKAFPNNYTLTLDAFLWLNFSASYAPKKEDKNYEIYKEELTTLFNQYSKKGILTMPNNTILRFGIL